MANKIPVTVVMITKNEQAGLGNTLSHLTDFDEIVIVDSASTDDTVQIALSSGARVVQFEWDGLYPKKKQWALDNSKPKNEWVLLLDADEYPSVELQNDIRSVIDGDKKHSAYDLKIAYRFGGRVLSHGHRVWKRSLLRSGTATFPNVNDLNAPGIREVEGHYQPAVVGTVGRLSGSLIHDDRDPVHSWFNRHNNYSDWEAYLRAHQTTRNAVTHNKTRQGQLFDRSPLKPVAFFVYSYVARAGFLDGQAGLDYALAMSMYYWQIGLKHRELQRKILAEQKINS